MTSRLWYIGRSGRISSSMEGCAAWLSGADRRSLIMLVLTSGIHSALFIFFQVYRPTPKLAAASLAVKRPYSCHSAMTDHQCTVW